MNYKLEEMPLKLSALITSYSSEVGEEIEKRLDETASDILDYIRKNCPRSGYGSSHLADSFILTTIGSGANKTIYISSSTKGRLVHLVELGFRHRSGKMVPARPFLRPAYETLTPKMLEDIKEIIRRGN